MNDNSTKLVVSEEELADLNPQAKAADALTASVGPMLARDLDNHPEAGAVTVEMSKTMLVLGRPREVRIIVEMSNVQKH